VTIKVKLFAILRDRVGASEFVLDLPEGATVDAASSVLAMRFPAIADFLPRVAFAINQTYADRGTILRPGDELAIIPPVSGG